ncbi:MAG: PAS domain-containing sensor histidine kinase [Myxococcaceae bacterium]
MAAAQEHPPSFEALSAALPVGLALFDAELRFVRLNPQLARWNRWNAQDLIGKSIFDVLEPASAQRLAVRLREVLERATQLGPIEVEAPAKDTPQPRHWLATYFPVQHEGREAAHVGMVLVDITTQKRAELERTELWEREQAAREELAQSLRYHEVFAGLLGHDLRNPLGSIMAGAELLLRRAEDDVRISDPAGRIFKSAERMSRMVDQLLDYARTRIGGGLKLERGEVDLAQLAKAAIAEQEKSAQPKGAFELAIAGNVRGWWDGGRVEQLLSSLVSNAAHHGEEGPRLLSVDGRDPNKVVLSVHNPGAIEVELLGALFDPLRAKQVARRRPRGLGLGLYLSQQIALAHEGLLQVSSSAEEGTRFTLELPRSAGTTQAKEAVAS